eukprot:CAMPEP_0195056758 /NCGR_PEP_ID=MMETSP0448-20130528/5021_1 /TAXON_ID=66468 /ORGANISM="Heterocapsa triquestra, Strain CCMP 448" /LENGTH=1021 /DNA_ID=CAMNT_0040086603 /DNA_START=86 /DNA_END=3148 /DNA_ORIENTATION=-
MSLDAASREELMRRQRAAAEAAHAGNSVRMAVMKAYLREFGDRLCGCICGGRSATRAVGIRVFGSQKARAEFEELISFISVVPIFRKQLPKSELPRVASSLKRTVWQPGDRIVEQGKLGKAFFIILSGEASVVVQDSSGQESTRVTLYHMDYFGGHTLTENRPNVATILVKGPMPLVTLSLSREEFERLGLNRKLKFAARPAIYDGRKIEDGKRTEVEEDDGGQIGRTLSKGESQEDRLTQEESDYIAKAIVQNPNLRARGRIDLEAVNHMAALARRRHVKAGSEILKAGEMGDTFYVVARGSFDVFPGLVGAGGHQSVEALVASSKAAERLGRKERFLLGVVRNSTSFYAGATSRQALSEMPKIMESRGMASQSMIAPTNHQAHLTRRQSSDDNGSRRGMAPWTRSVSETPLTNSSPFRKGDVVSRVVKGQGEDLVKETGTVVQVEEPGPDGKVMVEFEAEEDGATTRKVCLRVVQLRPAEREEPIAVLQEGECMGELALLYNTRQLCTMRAKGDCQVYAIERRVFKRCFGRESNQLQEMERLLDQVDLLASLLVSERAEIARNARGFVNYKAGVKIIEQGAVLGETLYYVVSGGVVYSTKESDPTYKRELTKGDGFGHCSTLQDLRTHEFTITVGPGGAKCLVVPGAILRSSSLVAEQQPGTPGLEGAERHGHSAFSNASEGGPSDEAISMLQLDSLEPVALLGEGGFGSVYLVRTMGHEYALKRLSKGYIVEQNMQKQIVCERDILSMVDSPFIVHFYKTYKDAQFLYVLMEFAAGGHLYSLLNDRPHVLQRDEPRGSAAMFYVACVICALEHMHERRIVYRDLKPENVLLDSSGYAKICDLGFARFCLGKSHTMVGTPEYMAPEMIDAPHTHDGGVDWWALGVLTFEMLTGQVPWDDQGAPDTMMLLFNIRKGQDSGLPERLLPSGLILAKDFIKKLLAVDEEKRAGRNADGAEIKKHPWFTYSRFDFQALAEKKVAAPYRSQRKVVERMVRGMQKPWARDGSEDALFVDYEEDGTG